MNSPIRVVIADDHTLVREGTREILDREPDIEVVGEAGSGTEAVALIGRLLPDLALVDVGMPGLNGVEVTRQVKAAHPSTGVLVLTVHDDDAYVFAALEAGAAGYLLKDVRGEELVEAIRSVSAGESVLHPTIVRKVLARFRQGPEGAAEERRALSDRELDVLRLAAVGLSNKEIGVRLGLSPRTVQVHLSRMFHKLQVASRTEAVVYGLRRGWLQLEDLP